jgi:hypothetical protein
MRRETVSVGLNSFIYLDLNDLEIFSRLFKNLASMLRNRVAQQLI